jgi:hypothetical protein
VGGVLSVAVLKQALLLLLKCVVAMGNLLSRIAGLRCFECGKGLRLKVVAKNGQTSIECSCCWKLTAGE